MSKRTLLDKIWDEHVIMKVDENTEVLYIDKQFIHEVTSPQAFDGLDKRNSKVFRPQQTLATMDHIVPTKNQQRPVSEPVSKKQLEQLALNCRKHNIELYDLNHPYQGIVHVIGPELGHTLPGMTIVCGDSHTSTHGALGAIAFGIGTSEVEHVLASQCLLQKKPKYMLIQVDGKLRKGVTAKDIILFILSKLKTSCGNGFFIEFAGTTIKELSMEGRMTICNMSIELGARGGIIAPDETTFNYIRECLFSPKDELFEQAAEYWQTLYTDKDAIYDKAYYFDAGEIEPMITYGTNPGMAIKLTGSIPFSEFQISEESFFKALKYMDFLPGKPMIGAKVNYVFIGSCTNGRIEDIRAVAKLIEGRKIADNIKAMVVPGSKLVLKQAVEEGLDKILTEAGFDFREPGCSACLAMNEDKVPAGEYCVSTANRNFEGRQGEGSRTILASPLTAAATAIFGKITDPRVLIN
jgi:3-isopropylmalate/(R)-2-methylmalate dehydratase large subunit